jgi:hypothetical protein
MNKNNEIKYLDIAEIEAYVKLIEEEKQAEAEKKKGPSKS